MLRSAPLAQAEARANLPHGRYVVEGSPDELPEPPRSLVVPDVRPYPSQFWADVAATYVDLVLRHGVKNPAVVIAEHTKTPAPTVRGWIAKCRTLGLIAKGSQGRLG